MKKTDCFAYRADIECSVFGYPHCDRCSFYKTKEQYDDDRKTAADILVRKGLCPCEKHVTRFDEYGIKRDVRITSVRPV